MARDGPHCCCDILHVLVASPVTGCECFSLLSTLPSTCTGAVSTRNHTCRWAGTIFLEGKLSWLDAFPLFSIALCGTRAIPTSGGNCLKDVQGMNNKKWPNRTSNRRQGAFNNSTTYLNTSVNVDFNCLRPQLLESSRTWLICEAFKGAKANALMPVKVVSVYPLNKV